MAPTRPTQGRLSRLSFLFNPASGGASPIELGALLAYLVATVVVVSPLVAHFRYLFLPILAMFAVINFRRVGQIAPYFIPVFLLLTWAGASIAWSPRHGLATLYCLIQAAIALASIYVGAKFGWRQTVILLVFVLGVAAVLSVLDPNTKAVYADAQQATLGIFAQKNTLGKRMMILAVAGVAVLLDSSFPKWQRLGALAFLLPSLFLVIHSRSTTALLLTTAGIAMILSLTVVWFGLRRVRGARSLVVILFVLVALASMVLIASSSLDPVGDFLGRFGKSADLTGRTDLWVLAGDYIREHPGLGAGVEGFWRPQSSEAVQIATQFIGIEGSFEFNFQNAFLEYGVHLGYPGMVLFAIAFIWGAFLVVRDFIRFQDRRAAVFLALSALIALRGLTESDMFREFDLNAMIFWIAVAYAARRQKDSLSKPGDHHPPPVTHGKHQWTSEEPIGLNT
ncbi:MAG: hypothetical protein JWM33_4029 [Caulobacteraceae bacterium]|nr:hypothetical protein [Caulobacteraceae bacterium]